MAGTCRTGMGTLVNTLRGFVNAGSSDYTIGTAVYWDDGQLQDALDRHKMEVHQQPMDWQQDWAGTGSGSEVYKEFYIGAGNLEQGTANFNIYDSNGSALSTSLYSVDYMRGEVTFTADQKGSARWVSCYSYDLNAAAADVWKQKMAYYAMAYDISTDGNNMRRSQLMQQCKLMADYYSSQQEINSAWMGRSDDVTY